jgi:hypothetical protein
MKVDGDRPRECRDGDVVWNNSYENRPGGMHYEVTTVNKCGATGELMGTHRWHIMMLWYRNERKNHPPKVEDTEKATMLMNLSAYELCISLGMKSGVSDHMCEDINAFIRDLYRRVGEERYSVEEVDNFIKLNLVSHEGWFNDLINKLRLKLNDPQDGIKAVTERREV